MLALALFFDGFDASQIADAFNGPFATYAYVLIGYHIVLILTILFKNKEKGFSMPLGSTLITHLACLTVVLGLAVGRDFVPFFGIIKFFIPGIAPFEANWLFSGGKKQAEKLLKSASAEPTGDAEAGTSSQSSTVADTMSAVAALPEANADEYEEFLKLLHLNHRPFRRPGSSVKEEFERWRTARAKEEARAGASSPTV